MFCTTCGYQEDFCRCPMRTQDLVLSVAIVCLAVAFAIAMWSRSMKPVEFPPEQQEQGFRPQPVKVPWRRVPPPPPPSRLA
jgi:hypothetical protein